MPLTTRSKSLLIGFLATLLIIKLLAIFQTPVLDPSESRYAEMARKMYETRDWITPQFDYGTPFWGKPPLSTWVSATGIALFGSSAAAARLPILVIALSVIYLLYRWIRKNRGEDFALLASILLSTTPIFFYLSSAVMTDLTLTACTTLAMVSFYRKVAEDDKDRWGFVFFISLGLAFLAKGPAAIVLIALPLALWTALAKQWHLVFSRLSWVSGTLLASLIGIPWYIFAEIKTPGFINYFIVGEHLNRFLVSGWEGDLYGRAHNEPIGTIWIFWLLTALPWSLVLLFKLKDYIKNKVWKKQKDNHHLLLYLSCWVISPLLFFTFAQNIIATYAFTGIPALPFLIMELNRITARADQKRTASVFAALCGTTFLLFLSLWIIPTYYPEKISKHSQHQVINYYQSVASPKTHLSYWKRRFNSAEFYMNGDVKTLNDPDDLQSLINNQTLDYLVVKSTTELPEKALSFFEEEKTFENVTLLREHR